MLHVLFDSGLLFLNPLPVGDEGGSALDHLPALHVLLTRLTKVDVVSTEPRQQPSEDNRDDDGRDDAVLAHFGNPRASSDQTGLSWSAGAPPNAHFHQGGRYGVVRNTNAMPTRNRLSYRLVFAPLASQSA